MKPSFAHRPVPGGGSSARRRTQAGLGLIELLIAMVVGLAMIGTLVAIYLSARQSTRAADQNSRLQDAGRFALATIGREVRQAGWSPILLPGNAVVAGARIGNAGVDIVDVCWSGYTTPTAGLTTRGGCRTAAGPGAFTVRYVADAWNIDGDLATGRNCAGDAVAPSATPPGTFILNRFYVRVDAGRPQLRCAGASLAPGAAATAATDVPFIDNVEDLRLHVGVDNVQPLDGVADQWFRGPVTAPAVSYGLETVDEATVLADASTIGNAVSTPPVATVALRVCVQVVSPEPIAALQDAAANDYTRYTDCDGYTRPITDGRLRRVFWATFGLRNNLTRF